MVRGVSAVLAFAGLFSCVNSARAQQQLSVVSPLRAAETADFTGDESTSVYQTQFGGLTPPFTPAITESIRQARESQIAQNRGTRSVFTRASMTLRRRRLSRVPDMLGDTFLPSAQINVMEAVNGANGLFVVSPLMNAAGNERTKVGENNKALPVDRFYLNYNHFHNAVRRQAMISVMNVPTFTGQSGHADRFVLGVERTLLNGDASVELRLPLASVNEFGFQNLGGPPGGDSQTDSGVVGNASVIVKHLLIDEDDWRISAGLGVDLPTGDDGHVRVNESVYTVANQSAFLHPFVAFSTNEGDTFVNSFIQIDVPLHDNSVSVGDITGMSPLGKIGALSLQTLLHWDLGLGRWLLRQEDGQCLTGLAALAEFHLTTALNEADLVTGARPTLVGNSLFAIQSSTGQYTASYLTTGLHAEFRGDWTLRVASVLPLRSGRDRFFDAELMVQAGRRY